MSKKPDQPDRITLDLLARATFEIKRLHDDRNELELISTAYDFLRSCQAELENAPKRIAKMMYTIRSSNWLETATAGRYR